jgi:hypothetical protein
MAPVFELLPLEDEDVGWGDDEGEEGEGETEGNIVGFGDVVPVGPGPMVALVVFEAPINAPGPISGLSKRCTCEGAKEKTKIRISYHQYPSP